MYRNQVVLSIFHWAAGNTSDPFNINEDDLVAVLKIIWARVFSKSIPFKFHAVVSVVSKAIILTDLLTTTFRPINTFLSGATVSHQQQRQHSSLSLWVMSHTLSMMLVWHLQLIWPGIIASSSLTILMRIIMCVFFASLICTFRCCIGLDWHVAWTTFLTGLCITPPFNLLSYCCSKTWLWRPGPQRCHGTCCRCCEWILPIMHVSSERMQQLECTLNLIMDQEIDIKIPMNDTETTGTKRKRKVSRTWKLVQLNGSLQPFSDYFWGDITHDYMVSLQQVPPDVMKEIVKEAKSVTESQRARTLKTIVLSTGGNERYCGEHANLALRWR